MNQPIDDGGKAFPCPAGCGMDMGMTLLDYFAAAALQGLLANPDNAYDTEPCAEECFKFAQAMIKERSKP